MIFNNAGNCVSKARDTFSPVYKRDIKPDRDHSHMRVHHFAVCVTRNRDVHVIANKYENVPMRHEMIMKGARKDGLQLIKNCLKPTHKFYDELIAMINDELAFYD